MPASAGTFLRRIRRELAPPVHVFQMGKVGSSSIYRTLLASWPGRVLHAHHPRDLAADELRSLRRRRRLGLPVLVISPVRSPIARTVSSFFENFEGTSGHAWNDRDWTVDELRALFLERAAHRFAAEWHERQLRPLFGIDVFAKPFPRARGWDEYRSGPVRALVYRSDLDRDAQLETVSRFLGRPVGPWVVANEGASKEYGDHYRALLADPRLPALYARLMHQGRFASHFWTRAELDREAERWTRAAAVANA